MVNKRITLSINSKVIEAIKKFAAQEGISLSRMVENFLRSEIGSTPINLSTKKEPKLKGHFKKLR